MAHPRYSLGLAAMSDGVLLGMFDLQQVTRNLNALKPVTVDVARILVRSALEVIGRAIDQAKQPWYKSDLPGETERKKVKDALEMHASSLTKYDDGNMGYPWADDLKRQTIAAYVDANAVEEGAAYLERAWQDMWNEIQKTLQAMPREALKALAKGGGLILETATGIPPWAWLVGGVLTIGLVGFVGYKIATGPVGGAVARRYLG